MKLPSLPAVRTIGLAFATGSVGASAYQYGDIGLGFAAAGLGCFALGSLVEWTELRIKSQRGRP